MCVLTLYILHEIFFMENVQQKLFICVFEYEDRTKIKKYSCIIPRIYIYYEYIYKI